MKRLERILAALTPNRWPVRWRLAAVSAALTLIILVIFAVVVGRLTSNRLQSSFDNELRDNCRPARSPDQHHPGPLHRPSETAVSTPREMALVGERRNSRGHPSGRCVRAAWDPPPRATRAGQHL